MNNYPHAMNNYMTNEHLPLNKEKVNNLSTKYIMLASKVYKIQKSTPMLRISGKSKTNLKLIKVHKGVCRSRIAGKSLANKLLIDGYYWPNMLKDKINHVNKCKKCQRYSNLHRALV